MQQNTDFLNTLKRNIMITLSYDGSSYHGWQIQKNALTIQEIFQNSLEKIIKEKVDLKGCSRTDAGVHANMYVLNFKTTSKINCDNLIYALNRFLPPDIAVIDSREVSMDFHARYSCTGKEYIYKIWNHRTKNPFLNNRALHYWYPLDINELNTSAQAFIGTHNFTSFATLDKRKTENMVRNLKSFAVYRSNEDIVEFKVNGDGFLYNMVRIMVGTLLKIAQRKINKEDISRIIKSKDRALAGPTAPALGLYLNQVFYEKF